MARFLRFFVIPSLLGFLICTSISAEPRRVLIEFNSGTWCGYCPCADSIINKHCLVSYPQSIVLAYHGPQGSPDPFKDFNGNDIINQLGFIAYPTALFDRHSGEPLNFDFSWPDSLAARYSRVPESSVRLVFTAKSYISGTRQLNADISCTALQNLTGQFKISYVIIENNIIYPQNVYPYCHNSGPIQEYLHNWIVRNMVNSYSGEDLNSGTWNQNQVITKHISTTLDTSWNAANCNLVVFVFRDSSPLNTAEIEQSTIQSVTNPIGITGNQNIPAGYSLSQNYPNPFNPATNIKFSVPKHSHVSLRVFDILGRLVETLVNGELEAGQYNAEFDGSSLSSGVYYYRLEADGYTDTKKLCLIK